MDELESRHPRDKQTNLEKANMEIHDMMGKADDRFKEIKVRTDLQMKVMEVTQIDLLAQITLDLE